MPAFPCIDDAVLEDLPVDLVDDLGFQVGEFVRYLQFEMRVRAIEPVEYISRLVEVSLPDKVGPNPGRLVLAHLRLRTVVSDPNKPGEGDPFDLAEADAEVLLEFGLQSPSKVFIGFVGDDGQLVHRFVMDALAGLVDRKTQAAPDLLPFLFRGLRLVQGANLEDVRVVPTFGPAALARERRRTALHRRGRRRLVLALGEGVQGCAQHPVEQQVAGGAVERAHAVYPIFKLDVGLHPEPPRSCGGDAHQVRLHRAGDQQRIRAACLSLAEVELEGDYKEGLTFSG